MALPGDKSVTLPTVNASKNVWGTELNTALLAMLNMVAGVQAKNCAGMANVVLSATEAQKLIIQTTGVLTGNIYLLTPQPGIYAITNNCTGAFSLSLANNNGGVPLGTSVVCAQGATTLVISDGTNCSDVTEVHTTQHTYWCGTSTGSANAQLLTPVSASLTALTAGDSFLLVAGFTNTGSTTLAVSGTGGFQPFYRRTAAGPVPMAGGEIILDNAYEALWDGTKFQLMN